MLHGRIGSAIWQVLWAVLLNGDGPCCMTLRVDDVLGGDERKSKRATAVEGGVVGGLLFSSFLLSWELLLAK